MLDDVVELGECLTHRQSHPGEHLGIDELRDRVQHDFRDQLGVDAAEVSLRGAALDQPLEPGDALALMAHQAAVGRW